MSTTTNFYQIALSKIPGVGAILAKQLIAHCGSAEQVFNTKPQDLHKIGGIGPKTTAALRDKKALITAEKEIAFAEKENIKVFSYLDDKYPNRLKNCEDGPIILFQKGDINLNAKRVIAVVGTRNATATGLNFCEKFIDDLAQLNVIVISGLAYGIDACAHKEALKNQVPTAAVLAHGLDKIYPSLHKQMANQMLEQGGGWLTEHCSGTNPDRENFPKRNRIVAGISDAIVVVEAAKKGGALITAEIANGYNRDVFAVPGRLEDIYSEGCNKLIKAHKAALITGIEDLSYLLGWEKNENIRQEQTLFVSLTEPEQQIFDTLNSAVDKQLALDVLCFKLKMPVGKILSTLMGLELKGLVKNYPGKLYALQR